MLCYHCEKASGCSTFRNLYSISKDFCINECKNFEDSSCYTYMKIAENKDLMRLIYDYFVGILEGCTEDEAKEAITCAMWNL